MPCRRTRQIGVGLLIGLVIATPAAAGSASATFRVSATVVSNCRGDGRTLVCTRGAPYPRTHATIAPSRLAPRITREDTTRGLDGGASAPGAGRGDAILVTVNF